MAQGFADEGLAVKSVGIPAGGATDEVLTKLSGADGDADWAAAAAGGGGGGTAFWTKDVDNPLTSLTDLTTGSGTWSINTYLQCVMATTTQCRAISDTPVAHGAMNIVEVEMEVPTGDLSGVNQHMRVGIGTGNVAGAIMLGIRGDDKAYIEEDGLIAVGNVAYTVPAAGTWVTVRLVSIGNRYVGYFDGVKVIEALYDKSSAARTFTPVNFFPYVGAYVDAAKTIRFRNLKAWSTNTFDEDFVAGGASQMFDLLHSTKPTADTPDDEFAATTLDGKWTAVTGASGTVDITETGEVEKYDLTTRPGWLLLQAGSAADQKVELRQDFTIPDGASMVVAFSYAWAAADGNTGITDSESVLAMTINDTDTGPQDGAHMRMQISAETDGNRIVVHDGSSYYGSTGIGSQDTVTLPPGSMIYLRVARIGTTYRWYASTNGTSWMPFGSKVIATAPTNFWIFTESSVAAGDPVPIHAVAWVRQGTNTIDPWNPVANVAFAVNGWEDWIAVSGGIGFSNSWVNFGGAGIQDAEYRKHSDGRIELRGLIKSGTLGTAAFTLPTGYRPVAKLHTATASNGAFGRLDVLTTGDVEVNGSATWVSLDSHVFDSTGGT